MESTLDLEQLRRCRLFIATPMYGAQCSGHYARPLADLTALCARWGIGIELSFVMHESLITRARNYLAHRFLASDATHLVFIDADIAFHAEDVLMLLQHSVLHPDHQVVSGSYPLKRINWDSVARAIAAGTPPASVLADPLVSPLPGTTSLRVDQPAEVLECGSGFMLVTRRALESYAVAFPDARYVADNLPEGEPNAEVTAFFDTDVDPGTRRFLSEDYYFCRNVRAAGGSIWLLPWIELGHAGGLVFQGSDPWSGGKPSAHLTADGLTSSFGQVFDRWSGPAGPA